jgi:hypothetical protein
VGRPGEPGQLFAVGIPASLVFGRGQERAFSSLAPFLLERFKSRQARRTLIAKAQRHKAARRSVRTPVGPLCALAPSCFVAAVPRRPPSTGESLLRALMEYGIILAVKAHSSRGLGRGPLKAEIRGSNPLCATMHNEAPPNPGGAFSRWSKRLRARAASEPAGPVPCVCADR